ncbi:hypothetical protein IV102_00075 [bacterium]|nr:hypothetical protein [bacterium]
MTCNALHSHRHIASTRPVSQNQSAPAGSVDFSQNPQDKVVLQPGTYTVQNLKGGETPEVEKAKLSEPLQAENGAYVFADTDPRFHAANSFSAVARTIQFFEEGTGIPVAWAFGEPQITVVADGGEMLNAYYQRAEGSVNFFHSTDAVTSQVVYSGDSGEVVSHEAGHAILDGMRPAYLMNWRTDCGAFHESFGDMLALVMSVQDDKVLAQVVEQTGGDMTRPNMAANLGEELGITINHKVGKNHTGGDYTRTAINKFKWQDPKTLPKNPENPDELGSEVHNFSRLFTGAFYDVFTGLVNENRANGMEPGQAIREASNEGIRMLGRLLKAAPRFDFTYRDMAKCFVQSERDAGGSHADLVAKVYKEREILPANLTVADVPPLQNPTTSLTQEALAVQKDLVPLRGNFGNFSGASVEIARDPQAPRFVADDDQVRDDIKRLIDDGRILYTEPHQRLSEKDLFDRNGEPYIGVLRWRDGQPVIERNTIVT